MSFPRGQTRQATGGAVGRGGSGGGGGRGGGGGSRGRMGGMFGGPAADFTPVPKERRGQTIGRIVAFFRPYRIQVFVVLCAILVTSFLG